MKLVAKVPAAVGLLIVLVVIALGTVATVFAARSLQQSAEDRLVALVDARRAALADYLSAIEEDLKLTAENAATLHAMSEFNRAYAATGADNARRLYIDDNPNRGNLGELTDAGDGSDYSQVHARYHRDLRAHSVGRGYYDIFLLAPNGDLVYSYTKEADFATSMATGP